MSTLTARVIISKNIKMDREYKHVLNYSEASMLALVRSQGHLVNEISTASFINETGHIYVPFTYAECLQSNYIAFQNPTYSNKWFFAFIDNVKFHSKNMQEISYTVDIWSTWFSYLTIKPCFVVREHVNDDTIGLHLKDENLDVGEVISIYNTQAFDVERYFYIVVASTYNPIEEKDFFGVSVYNKNVFGAELFMFKIDTQNLASTIEPLILFLTKILTDKTSVECVNDMFIIPTDLISQNNINVKTFTYDNVDYIIYTPKYTVSPDSRNIFLPPAYTPSGHYTPVNNKCYCYPYNYLYVSNNSGNSNIYKYEDFEMIEEQGIPQILFYVKGAMSIGYDVSLIPTGYKGVSENVNESIPLGKYPVAGWSSDSYTNWLTQNSVNIPLKILGIGNTAIGYQSKMHYGEQLAGESSTQLASVGVGMNIATNILSTIGDFVMAKMLPNIEQGSNLGSLNFSNNKLNFSFYQMRCKDEFLKQIDNYFTMCGYKICEIKTPNITGRRNFNYIEISKNDCLGYGNIPSKALDVINSVAGRGLTIWHNHANLGDYTVQNDILS